jgi:hypothetical protein
MGFILIVAVLVFGIVYLNGLSYAMGTTPPNMNVVPEDTDE